MVDDNQQQNDHELLNMNMNYCAIIFFHPNTNILLTKISSCYAGYAGKSYIDNINQLV